MANRQTIQAATIKKVQSAINSYGYPVPIYRDIYEVDAMGCKVLKEEMVHVHDLQCVIDNSSSSRSKSITNNNQGIIKGYSYATLYATYVKDFPLQEDDFIVYEDTYYKVIEISDVVHYNLLYQVSLERVDLDGEHNDNNRY